MAATKVMAATMDSVVGQRIDLFGPSVEYLTSPYDAQNGYCMLRGTIPASVSAPLHSHPDVEDFYVVSGEVLVVKQGTHGYESIICRAGDHVRVPGSMPHGWRNVSSEPTVSLIVTTSMLGKFFLEAGRPIERASEPATPDDFARLANVSAKHGYWNAAPEENAAVGIRL
jgi:uncharacterized RmlC-like cupin family protein